MRASLLTGLYLLAAPLAAAQAPPSAFNGAFKDVQSIDSKDISSTGLTIYPDNLGLVRETRTVDLPAGVVDIRFFGVSDMILPQSAVLEEFEGLRLEGNFDSDLTSPAKLLERSVGETVTIRRVNPVTGASELVSAELVSAAPVNSGGGGAAAIFSTADGVEGYQCSGLAESLLLSKLPDDLHSIPVLSTRVVSETAGPKDITLTYITRGMGWSADYRMDVETGKDEVGLLGWLTLNNKTSKSFKDTELSVVAGTLNQVTDRGDSNHRPEWDRVADCVLHSQVNDNGRRVIVQSASTSFSSGGFTSGGGADEIIVTAAKRANVREAKQEDLGDYKLYRAPQAVSVEPYQTKQIAFLSKHNVALKQEATYRWKLSDIQNHYDPEGPIRGRQIYELDNSLDGNLAVPLPAGTVRAMSQTEDGHHVFIGEDDISNTAVGLPVELEMTNSFLVTAQFHEIDQDGDELEARVEVKNATDKAITAEFDFDIFKDVKILGRKVRKSFSKAEKTYSVSVPAEGTVSFAFKAEIP